MPLRRARFPQRGRDLARAYGPCCGGRPTPAALQTMSRLERNRRKARNRGGASRFILLTAGVLARAPSVAGRRRSDWLAVDKGWLR